MKGYKAFNSDLTCRGFKYEIGKEYEFDGKPIPCRQGFHFCKTIAECYNYYAMDDNTRVCEIDAFGEINTKDKIKYCTDKIRIIKEIKEDFIKKGNTNSTNTGYCNTGYCNTGNRNTGNRNTGNRNTGDCNTGNRNTGNCNTGDCNTGNRNTGNCNTGDCNTGNCNTGDYNTGHYNTGDYNTGYCNTGNRNTGDYNTGHFNTGNRNTGNCNTGNRNTGNRNTGNRNTGDGNTGDWNITNFKTGCFNTEEKGIELFNNDTNITFMEWRNSMAYLLLNNIPSTIVEWVYSKDMSESEKDENPEYMITGGYLKVTDGNESSQEWFNGLSKEEQDTIKSIPNFDAEIFKKCTGIDVNKTGVS